MDEKQISTLKRYFYISSITYLIIYVIYVLLSFFKPKLPPIVLGCLMLMGIVLLIVQDDVNSKVEKIKLVKPWGMVSLPSFTLLLLIFHTILYLIDPREHADRILWVIIAQYDSLLFDKSFRALRKLRQL